jgi:hypothetical protein
MEKITEISCCMNCNYWVSSSNNLLLPGKCYRIVEQSEPYTKYDKPYSNAPPYFKCVWYEDKVNISIK